MVKNIKGITLITLVITIIILLLLAGISINAVFGENGLIKRSKEALDASEISAEKEIIELAVADCIFEKDKVTIENLEKALPWENGTYEIGPNEDLILIKSPSGRYYIVNPNDQTVTYVEDITPPVVVPEISLSLNGSSEIILGIGATYVEEGATLIKNGENISDQIIKTGQEVNTSVVGEYIITYTYTDSETSETYSVTRKVMIRQFIYNFDQVGSHTFYAPYTGKYQLEVWGAQRRNSQWECRRKRWIFKRRNIFRSRNYHVHLCGRTRRSSN